MRGSRETCWSRDNSRSLCYNVLDMEVTSVHTEDIQYRLLSDLRLLSLPVDEVDVFFRPYSKTFYGRYYPSRDEAITRPRLFIYPFANRAGELLPYDVIMTTAIHEMCHHIQYTNGHNRVRGVMHDTEFWKLYNHYVTRAQRLHLMTPKEA